MRKEFMAGVKRIVIKIGTNSIVENGYHIRFKRLERLAFVCSTLMQEGKEVVIVTSGAMGVGASHLQLDQVPKAIEEQQALAAVGQSILMGYYWNFFQYYTQVVGQVLLTRDVVDFPTSYHNVKQTLATLIQQRIIPIINENDAVSDDELNHHTKFGDNDTLSAIVAGIVEADLLIILSDVDGLYDANPQVEPNAQLISHVSKISDQIEQMASGKGSTFSTGGMTTKLSAAKLILDNHQAMVITSSENPDVLFEILDGEEVGTLFKRKDKEEWN